MEPVLIKKETKTIEEQKSVIVKSIAHVQYIYNKFKEINVTLDFEQITNVNMWAKNQFGEEIRKLVVDSIIDKQKIDSMFGVPLNRQKLEELIDTPDLTKLIEDLQNYPSIDRDHISYATDLYMYIEDDVIKKKPEFDELIEDRYTHYTQNDTGVEIHSILVDLSDKINDYAAYLRNMGLTNEAENLIPGEVSTLDGSLTRPFRGLVYDKANSSYQPDLTFIRDMEKRHQS